MCRFVSYVSRSPSLGCRSMPGDPPKAQKNIAPSGSKLSAILSLPSPAGPPSFWNWEEGKSINVLSSWNKSDWVEHSFMLAVA